ncbi:ligand-gated channel protein [Tannerella sp. oral taxon BU063 isolate Cell 6/7/9]|uniref:Ligand-gated channel protein n=1 Tax=Tannerella sp. oral taxon BU063 isolate Cell 6/7/9 TaxID=1411021 RepID=W2CUE6_9BACT|nr:ligand-gated channel protein [Tannerella sp. oral taxon BU063 isolate Cell 6/7/9]
MLCAWASIVVVTAQERDTTLERRIDEVTVTATPTPRRLTATIPVQVVTGEAIRTLGLQNMADAVRRFAGTTVRDYGGIGGMKTVSVRSLGAHHTAISYDQVAMSNTQAGQIDIGRLSLDNVAMLTLSVGQEEDLLQSARMSASAAVLSIRTEAPQFTSKRRHSLQAHIRAGSFGFVNPYLRLATRWNAHTALSVDANLLRADGVYPFTLVNGSERTREKRYNSDIRSWHSEANLYHTTDRSELRAKVYAFRSERGLPGSVVLYRTGNSERLWDENFFAQANYRWKANDRWTVQAQGKYNYSWNKYEDTDPKYEGGRQTDLNTQHEYYASLAAMGQITDRFKLSLAQDGAINTLNNNVNDNPAPIRFTSLTALRARYRLGRVTMVGTALATLITERVKRGDRPADRSQFTPSFSLTYRPLSDLDLNLRALYKKTFRVPTFNDLYYLRIGNTGLRPELADEYNIGLTWTAAPARLIDQITLTWDGYYNEVRDKIVAFPSTYVWRMVNFGRVRIFGFDVALTAGVPLTHGVRVDLQANYTYQRATDVTSPEAKNYRDQIPYTPLHSGSGSAALRTPWIDAAYTVVAVGDRYYMSQNLPENRVNGYAEHTIALSRTFHIRHPGGCRIRVQAECVNWMDAQYDIIKYYPMPGRSLRATVAVTL